MKIESPWKQLLWSELELCKQTIVKESSTEVYDKICNLQQKCRSDDVYIAFCGHFSAGKSTIINELCRSKILPSSPIPTSANVVLIRHGDNQAWIIDPLGIKQQIDPAEVADLAKDGHKARTIELRYPIPLLEPSGVLLDTPGVDSTDEEHWQATEAAMHLADVICYIMDYNHVMSEINFEFAKRLSDLGKPLILVVNQIDKHRDQEISLEVFREGVDDAFRAWGIRSEALFFTSMRSREHPHNEFSKFRRAIASLIVKGEPIACYGIASAALAVVNEYVEIVSSQHTARKTELEQLCSIAEKELLSNIDVLDKQLTERKNSRDQIVSRLLKETVSIAENANITPATTREKARIFLESQQTGYRAGWFRAQTKTEAERAKRLQLFYEDFSTQVTAHLVWHVRDAVRKLGRELAIPEQNIQQAVEQIELNVSPSWLISMVHSGAMLTGEYVLNYAREIASSVRQMVKREVVQAAHLLADALEHIYARDQAELQQKHAEACIQLNHHQELKQIESSKVEFLTNLYALFPVAQSIVKNPISLIDLWSANMEELQTQENTTLIPDQTPCKTAEVNLSNEYQTFPQSADGSSSRSLRLQFALAADLLLASSQIIMEFPPLAYAAAPLRARARLLRDQQFTVALFGAFSAGKSSFANALLGEAVLPVSPNPTTAAINSVVPSTAEWPHHMAEVTMKNWQDLSADLKQSLALFDINFSGKDLQITDALAHITKLLSDKPHHLPPRGQTHLAFLRAFSTGWPAAAAKLGTKIAIHHDEFSQYVAEESISAFVQHIELHYDSLLSEQGVTLVDTPGADSIHARHTGVAFEYIKNADAIFFVTYYNHAFSRADRQFLEQLGRVKDSFELDKMFFIINAADLAADWDELQEVVEHVRNQLTAFGIRQPRLFPVSSLQALRAKLESSHTLAQQSGLLAFTNEFSRFAREELATLACRSAAGELHRANKLIQTMMQSAQLDQAERARAVEQLHQSESQAHEMLASFSFDILQKEVNKEITEQLYYVNQRLQYRFNEWYTASFNPSALREDLGDIKRSLAWAWREHVNFIRQELMNEILAVTLRMEKYMRRSIRETIERWAEAIRLYLPSLDVQLIDELHFATPSLDDVWLGEEPDLKLLTSYYRNAKTFFEGNGRDKLRVELEQRWLTSIQTNMLKTNEQLEHWAEVELKSTFMHHIQPLAQAIKEAAQAMQLALTEPWDLEHLSLQQRRFQNKVDEFERMIRMIEESSLI